MTKIDTLFLGMSLKIDLVNFNSGHHPVFWFSNLNKMRRKAEDKKAKTAD